MLLKKFFRVEAFFFIWAGAGAGVGACEQNTRSRTKMNRLRNIASQSSKFAKCLMPTSLECSQQHHRLRNTGSQAQWASPTIPVDTSAVNTLYIVSAVCFSLGLSIQKDLPLQDGGLSFQRMMTCTKSNFDIQSAGSQLQPTLWERRRNPNTGKGMRCALAPFLI